MVLKMRRKWSPWSVVNTTTKIEVAVKPVKLEVVPRHENVNDRDDNITTDEDDDDDGDEKKYVAIKIKWKGEPKFFPTISRVKREISSAKRLLRKKSWGLVQWDDDEFNNTCSFTVSPSRHHHQDHKFGAWEVAFDVLYGNKIDQRAKKSAMIGKVTLDIGEMAWKTQNSSVEQKLPVTLQIDGITMDANLTVLFNFVEIRQFQDPIMRINSTQGVLTKSSAVKGRRRRSLSQEEITLDESDELATFDSKDAARTSLLTKSGSLAVSALDKKEGWFSWTSKRISFKRAKTKDVNQKLDETADVHGNENGVSQKDEPVEHCSVSAQQDEDVCNDPLGSWQEKELISRDGQTKLKASIFFASFDQCSDKAAGESACTALVTVISHWLHSNSTDAMPNRSEFDNLIMQGSSEWRKLCEDATYVNEFPNKHFDLETVLRADIRPITISHEKSFVGFFGAESFKTLKDAMSFDDIWNEISKNIEDDKTTPRIYIVSWNDHFFVLKAEAGAYYIIDTLGERLYERCRRAYILRFDDLSIMTKHEDDKEKANQSQTEASDDIGTSVEEDTIICRGRECCKEFMKRFLATIPLKELLEEEEKNNGVSYVSLHQRLQIEFNYTCPSYPPSSSSTSSSPFSSSTDVSFSDQPL